MNVFFRNDINSLWVNVHKNLIKAFVGSIYKVQKFLFHSLNKLDYKLF